MTLPTPDSLLPGTTRVRRALSVLEGTFAAARYAASSADNKIAVVATGLVDLVSVKIAPSELVDLGPQALAGKVLLVCARALSDANAASAAQASAAAAGYNLPGFPAASDPPPTDGGFDRTAGSILASSAAVMDSLRRQRFEGIDGSVKAAVDGALELRGLSYLGPASGSGEPTTLEAATVNAINLAIARAKGLFSEVISTSVDRVVAGQPRPPFADARPRALLVIENVTTLRPSDEQLRSRLAALGFNVDVRKAAATVATDTNGRSLIVVSETIQAGDLGTKFTNAAVPMVVCEPTTFRDLKMTGGLWQTDKGDIFDQERLQITGGHPLAAGLTGLVTVTTKKSKFIWGKPATAALKIAGIVGQSTKWGIFGYDMGDAMVGMNAPARRVGFFAGRDTFAAFNADGWRLFDAAVRWATAARVLLTAKSTTLGAGDEALKQRLELTHGLEVTVRAEGDGKTSDLGEMRVHIVSESVSSTNVGARYLNSVAPTIVCDANLYDDMKMTGTIGNTDFGEIDPLSDLEVTPGHALAAGLGGTVTVVAPGQKFGWGKPGAEAAEVGHIVGAPDRLGIFAYEGGSNMVGARASAPRVGFFSGGNAPSAFTPAGWALFDAAVRWARAPRALLVVRDIPLREDDDALRKRLEQSFGFVVDVRKAPDVLDVHGNGKNVIVISESVASGDIAARLTNVAVPVVALEPGLFDDLKMTGSTANTDFGATTSQTEVDVVKADHPLAGGLTAGRVIVVGAPSRFVWGKPAASAIKIARLVGATDKWAVFGYEVGASMVGKTAPARRVGCFVGEQTALALNDAGRRLFDAAVLWAAGRMEVRGSAASLADLVLSTVPPGPSGGGGPPPTTTWQAGGSYDIGDEVTHLGIPYRCRQAHAAQVGHEPPITYALWARIATSGQWTPQVIYDAGDEVTYQGHRYRSIQAHQAVAGGEPTNAPALWQRLD